MAENQLQTIVRESGLEPTKARTILTLFEDYFKIADEWALKAKTIVVTDGSQTSQIEAAREGRLFLRDKRKAIETARVELKEHALREGKAIDGIANVLKALIIPIEEYLKTQENFVELKAKSEADERERVFQASEKKRLEDEENTRVWEAKRIQKENERLKLEARERNDRLAARERERAVANRTANLEKERIRKEGKNAVSAEKAKADAAVEALKTTDRIKSEEREKERRAEVLARSKAKAKQAKLEAELEALVECPECGHYFKPEGRGE